MLILTRRAGESIMIGDDIVITVVESGRDQVRLGVDAPRSIAVHRHEVYAAISQENEAARSVDGAGITKFSGQVSAASMPRRPRRSD